MRFALSMTQINGKQVYTCDMYMYAFDFTLITLVFLDRSQSAHLMSQVSAVQKYQIQKTQFCYQMQKTLFC